MELNDQFGRKFPYLRLSVTEVCNFRCTYCLPNGYQKTDRAFLTLPEIRRLVTGFAELGVCKIRLTGGEPTVRGDLTEIARTIHAIPGIRTVALTTNGYNLKEYAQTFFDAGIHALNVSVDSLDPSQFHAITGQDKLAHVLEGIEAAKWAGFTRIKVNSVLLREVTDRTLGDFLAWIKHEALSVRFIELMQTGDNLAFFQKHHVNAGEIIAQLLERGFVPEERGADAGPAQAFSHPDYAGTIGIIAPYAKDFCASCNRLRVTSRGQLMLCLFGEGGYDLRPYLQHDDQREELVDVIARTLHFKRASHYLQQGLTGSTPHLAMLGG